MRLSLVLMLFSAQVVFTCPPGCGKRSFEGPPQVESGGIQSANDAKKKKKRKRGEKREMQQKAECQKPKKESLEMVIKCSAYIKKSAYIKEIPSGL